ncbi:uncharacterized protein PADG_02768 [Paracoccidioides brasiliensis Pb18]|uniref:Uncharacterized protein n=1 Tax=Paracoccidioides brasiliensis (strain Pb18) TaxID=502780 RepID=C1G6G3_PARBD|nr:uncharacterized protein PADG_02768 [Paracoccidioides brasiliensis Pb18]EEH46670.2 hypothetical protein PADG_02768 [Paracoccidioides brasiliensis Pb18]
MEAKAQFPHKQSNDMHLTNSSCPQAQSGRLVVKRALALCRNNQPSQRKDKREQHYSLKVLCAQQPAPSSLNSHLHEPTFVGSVYPDVPDRTQFPTSQKLPRSRWKILRVLLGNQNCLKNKGLYKSRKKAGRVSQQRFDVVH